MKKNTNIVPANKNLTRRRAFFSIGTKVGIGLFAFIPAAEALLKSSAAETLLKSTITNTSKSSKTLAKITPDVTACSQNDPNRYCTTEIDACAYDIGGQTEVGALEHCWTLGGSVDCGEACVALPFGS